MKRHIRLSDLHHLEVHANPDYTHLLINMARENMEKRGLRYDNATGIVRDNSGELCRYVRQSDFEPHKTEEEVMRWEFSRFINNEAFRLSRV